MAEAGHLDRIGPLTGRRSASVTPLAPMTRVSFRGSADAVGRLGAAFGVTPATDACHAATAGDRSALWLGPDEWMLIAADGDAAALARHLEEGLAGTPHSLVDISHRNTGFAIVGDGAEQLLAEGCPLDLALPACPVGFCSRTVLGKAEVVLWRRAEDAFHVDCWRSFAPYLAAFLDQAAINQH